MANLFSNDYMRKLCCYNQEVETIVLLSNIFYQNIRWCKKESGDFIVMALQDPPFTTTLSKSKDGCIIMQKSMTYYSVLGSSYDQIMCESGYRDSSTICGNGSAYSILQIQTSDLEEGKG